MQNTTKRQIAILLSLIVIIIALGGATYAWFTQNRVTDTDSVSAKTNEDSVDLFVSSASGIAFSEKNEAEIIQVNSADKAHLMPVSTSNLVDFMVASGAYSSSDASLIKDDKAQYYYHGRIFLKAKAIGDHAGQRMTIYLDGTDSAYANILTAAKSQMVNASRVGITVDGKDPVILNFDNKRADRVATFANGIIATASDPSNYVDEYMLKMVAGSASRPSRALMNIELNKEYTIDIYYYLEGYDADCNDAITSEKITLQLAFYGVLDQI